MIPVDRNRAGRRVRPASAGWTWLFAVALPLLVAASCGGDLGDELRDVGDEVEDVGEELVDEIGG